MVFTVLHRTRDGEELVPVAMVRADDPEKAFTLTNHIDNDWTKNADVIKVTPAPCRSTSVGDVLIGGSKAYVVERAGFSEIVLRPEGDL